MLQRPSKQLGVSSWPQRQLVDIDVIGESERAHEEEQEEAEPGDTHGRAATVVQGQDTGGWKLLIRDTPGVYRILNLRKSSLPLQEAPVPTKLDSVASLLNSTPL